ncbi:MAG TPA: hypothetical protein VJ652_07660 [Noviherbaspirillum sp.]|nr:hypothetical protein [Noviherbaspirillum sp.]
MTTLHIFSRWPEQRSLPARPGIESRRPCGAFKLCGSGVDMVKLQAWKKL